MLHVFLQNTLSGIHIMNTAVSGNNSQALRERFAKDVLSYTADKVFILIGSFNVSLRTIKLFPVRRIFKNTTSSSCQALRIGLFLVSISVHLLLVPVDFESFYLIVTKFFSFSTVFSPIPEISCKSSTFWKDPFSSLNRMISCALTDPIPGICWSSDGVAVLIFILGGSESAVGCFPSEDANWSRCSGSSSPTAGIYRTCWSSIFAEKLIRSLSA